MTAQQFWNNFSSAGRSHEADKEAADRYRTLAANNPSLRRDYSKRAAECDRIAATTKPTPTHTEADIPAEWRNDIWQSYGEIQEPFTREESDAAELDRR